ncbi:MAG: glutathione S-transferase N-terminal domain-containing protein [Gammaproteobacteria bacterium]|nr:glutathione S-transferase N-terminal domain-containing protein [Gammaproteobacteria bacterium]
MQLRYSAVSPYARKVCCLAMATGLWSRITPLLTNPWDESTDLSRDNPLGKIPVLILEDRSSLYDSRVICEYLDSLHQEHKWFPQDATARWSALRYQALGDGIADAAVQCVIENRRPLSQQSPQWRDRQLAAMQRAIQTIELQCEELQNAQHIGALAIVCALGYWDFRLPEIDWRGQAPQLAQYYASWSQHAWWLATMPE